MPYIVDIPVPFDQYTETVRPEWIDHNGHTVSYTHLTLPTTPYV